MPAFRRQLPLFCLIAVALAALFLTFRKKQAPPSAGEPDTTPEITTVPPASLSSLAAPPDWSMLEPYQRTITREHFEDLLTRIFTVDNTWQRFIRIDDHHAVVQGNAPDEFHTIEFSTATAEEVPPRTWKSTADLPPASPERPLDGLHIAIDPGHIGGEWAKMEERWFVFEGGKPVTEGDMTLFVARLVQPKLEALGARVSLVRDRPEPVTPLRPDGLLTTAARNAADDSSPEAMQKLAQRLFYRTAEIHARAQVVNEQLKPDLVLCLHFNAESWGDPNAPTLIPRTHLHLLLNGGYTADELSLADQRFAMMHKILQGIHEEEALVGATVAETFAEISKLPPYLYNTRNFSVRPVNDHPFLWARNLLANRLYDCPVIFMEPYVMNSTLDHARIQAGDYDGLMEIEGEMRPSIFREYADALVEGLRRHYTLHRAQP